MSAVSLPVLLSRVQSSSIASIRGTVGALLRMLNDPDSKPCEIRQLIQADPPLAAKLLRVANSPYYASRRKITNIDEAFIWVGIDVLKEILLTEKLREIYAEGSGAAGYSPAALWRHSLAVAILARMIFRREFGERGCNAYAAGLMHDIGLIVLDQLANQEFGQVLKRVGQTGESITDGEMEVFGFDHGAVGRALLADWEFPEELAEAVGFHHQPDRASEEHRRLTRTIFLADSLIFAHGYGYLESRPDEQQAVDCHTAALGLDGIAMRCLVQATLDDLKELGE